MTTTLLVSAGVAAVALAALVGWAASSRAAGSARGQADTRGAHAADAAGDQRIAHDALLRLGDFPRGWTQTGTPAPIGTSHCKTVDGAKAAATARVISPVFMRTSSASAQTADDALYIDSDTATAQRSFAALTSHGTIACLARRVRRAVIDSTRGTGVTVGTVKTRSLGSPPVGNDSLAIRLTVSVSALGAKLTADADVVFVRVARGIEIFSLARIGGPFDPGLEPQLVRTGVGRLAADLGVGS